MTSIVPRVLVTDTVVVHEDVTDVVGDSELVNDKLRDVDRDALDEADFDCVPVNERELVADNETDKDFDLEYDADDEAAVVAELLELIDFVSVHDSDGVTERLFETEDVGSRDTEGENETECVNDPEYDVDKLRVDESDRETSSVGDAVSDPDCDAVLDNEVDVDNEKLRVVDGSID